MTERDQFAMAALAALAGADASIDHIVEDAYRIADAMLRERERTAPVHPVTK
jgi:hypothetical protein